MRIRITQEMYYEALAEYLSRRVLRGSVQVTGVDSTRLPEGAYEYDVTYETKPPARPKTEPYQAEVPNPPRSSRLIDVPGSDVDIPF